MKRKIQGLCCALMALCLVAQVGLVLSEGVAKAKGFVPRLSGYRELVVPDGVHALEGGIEREFTMGADLVVFEDTLAFYDYSGDQPMARVFVQRDGQMMLKAEYEEQDQVSNIVLDGYGLAYLVGNGYVGDVELVVIAEGGEMVRSALGPASHERAPYVGPLARLGDGRLLVLDGQSRLHICAADGTDLRQISELPMQVFVYSNQYVYFTHLGQLVTYPDVYCYEYDEYLDVTYPRLYRMRLDGSQVERVTDCGVRGLAAQGPYILYQNIDDPFVWPQGEVPEEWLYGVVYGLHTLTGQRYTLGLDSASYMATPHGVAAWMPDFPEGSLQWNEEFESFEGACPDFSLILYDWQGKPLYRLDGASLYWYDLPWFVTYDGIWMYEHNFVDNEFTFFAVPLDGSPTDP